MKVYLCDLIWFVTDATMVHVQGTERRARLLFLGAAHDKQRCYHGTVYLSQSIVFDAGQWKQWMAWTGNVGGSESSDC